MSKGLEALTAIEENFLSKSKTYNSHIVRILNIKTGKMYAPKELTEIVRNELKALEIIREKKVDTAKLAFVANAYFYNNFGKVAVIPITQEEFDLVTEVLYGKETS